MKELKAAPMPVYRVWKTAAKPPLTNIAGVFSRPSTISNGSSNKLM